MKASLPLEVGLTAAIVAMKNGEPMLLTTRVSNGAISLPTGPFNPLDHRTFEIGLRAWVQQQTGMTLGYVEQLYTFGDRGRHAQSGDSDPHVVSVGYLALTRLASESSAFRPWYEFLPWEDQRESEPEMISAEILPALDRWCEFDACLPRRKERVNALFPVGRAMDEENVLERYEQLYEAGLVEEAHRDGRRASPPAEILARQGQVMALDHRRILATAMGRLRAKIKYRPLIFELMDETFTLTQLQQTVEALSGRRLHKQNFRRLVETAAITEATGTFIHGTGGRPAALFRFRKEVVAQRAKAGFRLY